MRKFQDKEAIIENNLSQAIKRNLKNILLSGLFSGFASCKTLYQKDMIIDICTDWFTIYLWLIFFCH